MLGCNAPRNFLRGNFFCWRKVFRRKTFSPSNFGFHWVIKFSIAISITSGSTSSAVRPRISATSFRKSVLCFVFWLSHSYPGCNDLPGSLVMDWTIIANVICPGLSNFISSCFEMNLQLGELHWRLLRNCRYAHPHHERLLQKLPCLFRERQFLS